mgnify:CR=1 FL=1
MKSATAVAAALRLSSCVIADAFRAGMSVDEVYRMSGVDPWFLVQINDIVETEGALAGTRLQAIASKARYQEALSRKGYEAVSTEILAAPEFYYAEAYHQQYLAKNPAGYCGLGGTGVACPVA